jgi:hypothetical protein
LPVFFYESAFLEEQYPALKSSIGVFSALADFYIALAAVFLPRRQNTANRALISGHHAC